MCTKTTQETLSFEELCETDSTSIFHPITSFDIQLKYPPIIAQRGSGATLTTADGREYIDAAAGLWCVNVGYGQKRLAKAAYHEMLKMGYYHTFANTTNIPSIQLADKILSILRNQAGQTEMARVFFGNSGSDANDTAMKLVRYYAHCLGKPEKTGILSRLGGYHGSTMATASMTGIPFYHRQFGLPIDGVHHLSCPHYLTEAHADESQAAFSARLAQELEKTIQRIGPEKIGGFIAEPIMGTGGVIIPPDSYFDLITPILRKYDILIISDEVITGFGRLGSWFGCTHYGFQPDIITMAKGLTSGYFPVSAVSMNKKLLKVFESASGDDGPVAHGFTYSGHPVGCAIGLECLSIVEDDGLVENARTVGAYLKQSLHDRIGTHDAVGEIRGEGLMIGLEFFRDRISKIPYASELGVHKKVQLAGFENGVMLRALPERDVIALSPPLNITTEIADQITDRVGKSVEDAFSNL